MSRVVRDLLTEAVDAIALSVGRAAIRGTREAQEILLADAQALQAVLEAEKRHPGLQAALSTPASPAEASADAQAACRRPDKRRFLTPGEAQTAMEAFIAENPHVHEPEKLAVYHCAGTLHYHWGGRRGWRDQPALTVGEQAPHLAALHAQLLAEEAAK